MKSHKAARDPLLADVTFRVELPIPEHRQAFRGFFKTHFKSAVEAVTDHESCLWV